MQKNLRLRIEKYMIEKLYCGYIDSYTFEIIIKFRPDIERYLQKNNNYTLTPIKKILTKNYILYNFIDFDETKIQDNTLLEHIQDSIGFSIDFNNKKNLAKFKLLFYRGDDI